MKTSSTKTSTAASDVDVNGIDEVDAIVVENGNGKTPTEEIQLNHLVKYLFIKKEFKARQLFAELDALVADIVLNKLA